MRSTKKFMLLALLFSGASALSACGDANTGSPGEFKVAGGNPSQDPSGAAPGGGSSTPGGGGGTSTGTSTPTANGGTFAVAISSATLSSDLAVSSAIPITVTPAGGFTGTVTLSASGLPGGATGTFAPASIDITGTAPVTAMYTLDVPSDVTPSTTAVPVQITGTSGAATANAPLALTVTRKITMSIPMNVEADPTAFGSAPIVIHTGPAPIAPILVQFVNNDSSDATGHIVHSSNTANGFFHGDQGNPVKPGQPDALRTVTAKGDYPFYMHGESDSNGTANKPDGTISIVTP